jgi:hypothetical protein
MNAPKAAGALGVALLLLARAAHAEESRDPRWSLDPAHVNGVERPGTESGDVARSVLSAALWVPRQAVEFVFLATDAAAGIVENTQIVPRIEEIASPRPGDIVVFPTAFAETGHGASIGARMIATGRGVTTSLRAGYGGTDEVVGEAKIRLVRSTPLPTVLSFEGLADRRTDLQYLGLGQAPELDARNRFLGAPGTGLFREQRSRGIVSLGLRPANHVEIFLSSSLTRRTIDDAPDAGDGALSHVFARSSIPGYLTTSTVAYGEMAMRLDTRATRGKPSPGLLLEGYAGSGRGVMGDQTSFVRLGGRAAAFIPIYRRSNILSPKIVLDGLAPLGPVPFAELPGEPEFRGFNTRRDHVSLTGSLDYRYGFMRAFAARVFVDVSTVAPTVSALSFQHLRFAAGVGLDVSTASAELGRVGIAFSPDGALFLLSFGVPTEFGDRQHRD